MGGMDRRGMVNTHPQSVGGEKHDGQGLHVVLGKEFTTQISVRGIAMQNGTQDQRVNDSDWRWTSHSAWLQARHGEYLQEGEKPARFLSHPMSCSE